jgi:GlpG protein
MIAICVALSFHLFGHHDEYLMFSWKDIFQGQVWRLITPAFLHQELSISPWHLIFNMFWLLDLGTMIERRHGSLRFAAMVLVLALVSNLAQAVLEGPNFVGMSGVVYGLFGYVWLRGRLDPTSGFYLSPNIVFWMMLWLVACFSGALGPIAKWAHAGGLAAGAAIGYLAHTIRPRRWRS